jgi:amino acid adenylation domain-containing protein
MVDAIKDLLLDLKLKGVKLWVEEGRLRSRAPEGVITSDLRNRLRLHLDEIVILLQDLQEKTNKNLTQSIPKSPEQVSYPLSSAQRRLWVLDQLEENQIAYNMPAAIRLQGMLDKEALRSVFKLLVNRHESLRTVFVSSEGNPRQIIRDTDDFEVSFTDWQLEKSPEQLTDYIFAHAREPFDLARGPLLKVKVIRLEEEEHIMLFNMHHIISDGWSMEILVRELGILYETCTKREANPLVPLRIQYKDYAVWQNDLLQDNADMEILRSYWHDKLAPDESGLPILDLPADFPRPAVKTYRGAKVSKTFDSEMLDKLEALGKTCGATLFMTLTALVKVLLYRYSGQLDILIGSSSAGRTHADLQDQFGYYLNTLVLRNKVDEGTNFSSFLAQVKQTCLEAFEHELYPFDRLVEELELAKDMSRAPLFDVGLVLQNNEQANIRLGNLTVSVEPTPWEVSKFDLTFNFSTSIDGLGLDVEYNTDLYKRDRIERMYSHLECLIESVLDNSKQSIDVLNILPESERQLLLHDFNDTKGDFPADKTIVDLFEEQVEKTPDNIAVVFESIELTYQELNEKANQVGHYLIDNHNVQPDDIVALQLESSEWMIIAILGVMKAGGAYLPIDPDCPESRMQYMLENSHSKLLLTNEETFFNAMMAYGSLLPVLPLDAMTGGSSQNPECSLNQDHLAYVIYTSGSTGQPKGTMLEHQGAVNMALAQIQEFEILSNDSILQFATYTFDASISELLMTFFSGACLVLAKREAISSPTNFLALIEKYQVNVVTLPPVFLATLERRPLSNIKVLITAGDKPSLKDALYYSQQLRYFNAFGPTECSVCISIFEIPKVYEQAPSLIPIGRPINNTSLFILDQANQLLPIGIKGELCVSGAGLARGYINNPELTAEKFVPHPFKEGERLYKTGDLARWLADGNIEFLGRTDHQLKIRGYRIEAGEIEHCLENEDSIQKAVVTAHESQSGLKELVAYIQPAEKQFLPLPSTANTSLVSFWPSVAEFYVYDDLLYYAMTNDQRRNESYRVAINQSVKGKVVVEIGTGKDAVLARLCVEAGAQKVYAIELNAETYKQAREKVKELGLSEKIILIHGDATEVVLPEKGDVCVSEIVGSIGGSEGSAVIINQTRRLLKEEHIMIPCRSNTEFAVVSLPQELLDQHGFTQTPFNYVHQIFDQVGYPFDLRICVKGLTEEVLLSNRAPFEDLNYKDLIDLETTHDFSFDIHKKGRMDGFLVWLNLHTTEEEIIDILKEEYSWLPIFLPVFNPGLDVEPGDKIYGKVKRTLCKNNLNPDFLITGYLETKNNKDKHFHYKSSHNDLVFRHNEFYDRLFKNYKGDKSWKEIDNRLENWRRILKRRLPDYMVPTYFVELESVPLTSSGKVNRKALPDPGRLGIASGLAYLAPRNQIEQTLAEIWKEVLKRESIGIHDNFFNLGGHSLRAIRLVSMVQQQLSTELRLSEVFAQPTIAGLARLIVSKDAIAFEAIQPVAIQPDYALSHAQRRLWVLDQLEENQVAYNMPAVIRLEGKFDKAVLQSAFRLLVNRHESLRTTFVSIEGTPRQIVNETNDFEIAFTDWQLENSPEQLTDYISNHAQRPFDLTNGPLLNVEIICLKEEEYMMLYNMHHIISDGWSMEVLVKELGILYEACANGEMNPLAPLLIQYKDYAAWQNALLQDNANMEDLRRYWHNKLNQNENNIPTLDLPADYPRPAVKTYRGDILSKTLDIGLLDKLEALGKTCGATLHTTLAALVKVLLYRYSGQRDILIGSPSAGRTHSDLQNQIGYYLNTLVLRDYIEEGTDFFSFLTQVKQTCLEAFEHELYPYDQLVEELDIERDRSRSPLFDVWLDLHNNEEAVLKMGELQISLEASELSVSKFDLSFIFTPGPQGLDLMLVYNTDLYKRDRIERMFTHLECLIESVLDDSKQSIDELNILPESERQLLLYDFNDTKVDFPTDKTIIDLFEEQVEKTPDNIAVVFENIELTYQQLNEKANQVGHYLIDHHNVEPDDIIALQLESSEWMIITILGVMKAGGAYLPIDPDCPESRMQYMLEDSRAKVLLASEETFFNAMMAYGSLLPVLPLDAMTGGSSQNPECSLKQDHLAYVIYTSGSMGQPKGTLLAHRGIVNMALNQIRLFDIISGDRVLQFTNYTFDASVHTSTMALLSGAALIIAKEEVIHSPKNFLRLISDQAVSVMALPPGFLATFNREKLGKVRLLFTGGASPDKEDVLFYKSSLTYINIYGPTECSVCISWFEVPKEGYEGEIPIGKPIDNTQILILNEKCQLVPIGVQGELHASGVSLARGYLNNKELTEKKFIPHPFKEGERLYKTGDLARWLPDGNIQFLGRVDNQLKIRGFRIEAGEIEEALLRHPDIQRCIVEGKDLENGKELVAYLVGKGETIPDVLTLRNFLGESLPDYMVPAYFIQLETLPLTSIGKVDRKALPEPDGLGLASGVTYVAPRNQVEQALSEIWKEVLKRENIGIYDNFFDLGGHSLRAIRLVSLVQQRLSVEIKLSEVFAQPTIGGLASLITSKDAIEFEAIGAIAIQPDYALSHAQRRLWVLDQLEENQIAYNMPTAIRLKGTLDKEALQSAFKFLVNRHESLRTTFVLSEGTPRQIVNVDNNFEVTFTEWLPENSSEQLADYISDHAQRPFNLTKGSLLKVEIICLEEEEHMMLFNMHHIIFDGWSIEVLVRELGILYEACSKGEVNPLVPLRLQYKDYAAWQNALLEENAGMEDLRRYWHSKLVPAEGEIPTLDLPTDYPRPVIKTYRGANLFKTFDKELLDKLEALGKTSDTTLFMTLTALVKVLLYRYSGQRDILIGSPSAGRTHADLQDQIGFYLNMLVLGDKIEKGTDFLSFLALVKQTCLEAFEHELYPFDRLVEELDLARDMSRSALFDVMLVLQNNEQADLRLGDLSISVEPISWEVSKFDITFNFSTGTEGLTLGLSYNTDLYNQNRIERLIAHLEQLMESALANPKQCVDELNILPEAERQLILQDFNDTKVDFPGDKTIIDLFEQQVEKKPDNIAVVFEDKQLTYRQLNEKADQLGHYLANYYNIQPDDIIALQMERSEWMVIAILGVMKAGGAYLPIAPGYPKTRVEYMLKNSQAKVLLTDEGTYPDNKTMDFILPVLLVQHLEKTDDLPSTFHRPLSSGNDLAYVIYTSGSTGQPKGVMIEHQVAINLLNGFDELFYKKYEQTLNIGLVADYVFDASIKTLFGSLCYGHTLFPVTDNLKKDGQLFTRFLVEKAIHIIDCTPSLFTILLHGGLASQKNLVLKNMLIGGEALSIELVKKFYKNPDNKRIEIHNIYGPTEATVNASFYKIPVPELESLHNLPIGKPLPNYEIYIIDQHGDIQPVGISGEMLLGGSGLARGYLNRPEHTAEKFVPHLFKKDGRLYKTGDLARWLPDGNIEFLGRIDHQLKIRGYRIEAGEIEQALLQHSDIQSCVVIGKEFENNKELVAYLVNQAGTIPDALSLRSFLNESLPDYMIPAYFIELKNFPLTSSGKVDRKALPEPDGLGIASGVIYVAPRNQVEQALSEIWEELLKKENIGIHDNFFDLGGHSLRGIRLVSLIQQQLFAAIKLSEVFTQPTIAGLASLIISKDVIQFEAIEPVAIQADYALSHAQRRLWVLDQLEENQIAYNMPTAIRLKGKLDQAALQAAFKCLVNRHESLRTIFVSLEGNPRQIISDPDSFEVSFTNWQLEKSRERLADFISTHAQEPFDLTSGPLLKVAIICLEEEEHMMLFNMHHIISDGWSMSILVRELGKLYEAFAKGETNPLPPLRIQYKDYAAWQNALLQDNAGMERLRTYWHDKLAPAEGIIPTLDLPTDYPRPAIKTYRGASFSKTFDVELLDKLETLGKSCRATLFMTLAALVKVLLYRYSGQRDILIGSPSAGRTHADLQDQIGFYVNTLVLRDEIEKGTNFSKFLTQIKQTCLEAFEHELYPFDRLVEELDLGRDMSRSPLFDVMVVLQNNEEADLTLGDLAISDEPSSWEISKFDLTFNFATSIAGLSLYLDYNTDLYKRDRIERLFTHLECLIGSILNDSKQPVDELIILPETERQLILHDFNDTKIDFPSNKTIVDLFEEQVEKTPDKVAVVFEEKDLTYRQLNEKANQLGYYLITHHDIVPDDIIALQLERSELMIIAILGVLKAGAAYLPIPVAVGTDFPKTRVEFMLKDSQAKVLLTDKVTYPIAIELEAILPILELEQLEKNAEQSPTFNSPLSTANNLAYIIYTSGSSGQPKGVMIEHCSIVNQLLGLKNTIYNQYGEYLNTALNTSYTFDVSIQWILGSLICGYKLNIIPEKVQLDGYLLNHYLSENNIDIFNCTPTLFTILLNNDLSQIENFTLKHILIGGEEIQLPLLKKFYSYQRLEHVKITNIYGPTETTINTSTFVITKDQLKNLVSVPIGIPLPNYNVYIIDSNDQPLPIGIAGELCISGIGLARGYLNNPELTAENFVPHPFKPGERLYKTGDLACWLPDGNIEFLGRIDHQLKIRGYRIEAGEIELAILQHPEIQSCVVTGKELDNSKELVAYLVGKTGAIPDVITLRSLLSESLPDYMIPAYFVELETLPLTRSGKVNRNALPEPEGLGIASGIIYVAPRNQTEQTLVDIWEELLKRENIGIHDNFFDLGGHSLRAIRLSNLMTEKFNLDIPLQLIFQYSTIAALGEIIEEYKKIESNYLHYSGILFNANDAQTIFAFPPLFGLAIWYQELVAQCPQIPWYCFNFLEVENKLEIYYEQIKQQQEEGPYVLFGYSAGGNLAYEMALFMENKGEVVSDLIIADSGVRLLSLEFNFKEFLDPIENDENMAEEQKKLMKNKIFIKKSKRRVTTYHDFLNDINMDNVIHANIHRLVSKDGDNPKNLSHSGNWGEFTIGSFTVYPALGRHYDMFFSPNLSHNAAIVKNILAKIKESVH